MNTTLPWNIVRLFRGAVHLWLIGYVLTALPVYGTLWLRPLSPVLPAPSVFGPITHAFGTWASELVPVGLGLLLVACMFQLLRPARWYVSLLIWLLYTSLINQAWLAGSGGQQLMANMLFWLIFIPGRRPDTVRSDTGIMPTVSFWILRLQLLLAYLATSLHKLTGTHWGDGTAMGIAASDPAFGPAFLVQFPLAAMVLTWAVLIFQLTFPIAVWTRKLRLPYMVAGVVFHLGTAIWLGIPEMALAFIACYSLWLMDHEAAALLRPMRRTQGTLA